MNNAVVLGIGRRSEINVVAGVALRVEMPLSTTPTAFRKEP